MMNSDAKRDIPKALADYIPYQLHVVSNRLNTTASRLYRELFGLTISERRLLLIIAVDRKATANRACYLVGLDRALASRILRSLMRKGLIEAHVEQSDKRLRRLRLTDAGYRLHRRIDRVARERTKRLLRPFSKAERRLLVQFLSRLDQQVAAVNAYRPDAGAAERAIKRGKSTRRSGGRNQSS